MGMGNHQGRCKQGREVQIINRRFPAKEKIMIKIETQKEVVRGGQRRRIIKIEALSEQELPLEYVQGFPFVRLGNDGKSLLMRDGNTTMWMNLNELWDEEVFQKWLGVVKASGNRLKEINRRLAEQNKDWKGTETFCI